MEVWKCLGDSAYEFLTKLYNRTMESGGMPEEWRNSFWYQLSLCVCGPGESLTTRCREKISEITIVYRVAVRLAMVYGLETVALTKRQ